MSKEAEIFYNTEVNPDKSSHNIHVTTHAMRDFTIRMMDNYAISTLTRLKESIEAKRNKTQSVYRAAECAEILDLIETEITKLK